MTGNISTTLAPIEAAHLRRLLNELRELLTTGRDITDPAISRLVPSAYPDDDGAADAFAHATRDDLLDTKVRDADAVIASLPQEVDELAGLDGEGDPVSVTVLLDRSAADAWMRTLTALRLVLAARLGITSEDERSMDDPAIALYDWIGYRLELVIEAADDADEESGH